MTTLLLEALVLSLVVNLVHSGGAPCPPPPSLDDGSIINHPVTPPFPGTRVNYTCDPGFTLEGPSTIVCTAVLTESMGFIEEWIPLTPGICQAVNCSDLNDPPNGEVSVPSTSFGSMATYTCDDGFSITAGDAMRECQANQTWSGEEPTCTMDPDCGNPPHPRLSYVRSTSTSVGSLAMYFCYTGYTLEGNSTRECLSDGTWSGTTPSCNAAECPPLSPPSNSRIFYTRGQRVVSSAYYYCSSGFRLRGNRRRVCRPNREWTGSTPSCVEEDDDDDTNEEDTTGTS